MESKMEDIAQISGEIDYGDAHNIMGLANKDAAFRKKVRALVGDWEDAAEAGDEAEMTRIAKGLKTLVPAESKTEGAKPAEQLVQELNDIVDLWKEDQDNRTHKYAAADAAADIRKAVKGTSIEADANRILNGDGAFLESAKRIIALLNKGEANENTHLVDLGLDAKFKDMIDSVFGQLSDGYWENSPRMRGYWKFATPILKDNKIYLEIDNAHWNDDGAHTVYNLWDGMSDARVKQFLADKIKFLVKEEGLKWDRGNTNTTDYLSYSDTYSVEDCYYAYELLKGRNVSRHPEYSEAYIGIKDGKEFPVNVEYIEVDDDWQGNTSPDIYKVSVNGESGETDATETEKVCVGKVLRELGYSLKESKKRESGFEGWDGWEDVEGLEDAINGIEQLTYELRTCVRGSKTRCKTWAELGAHIAQLGSDLAEAGENASMKSEMKLKRTCVSTFAMRFTKCKRRPQNENP